MLRTLRILRPLLLLLLCLPALLSGCARETPAEHAASLYAQHELDAAPPHGNLPDYSLSPADLAKAQHLSTIHTTLHFVAEAWDVLSLVLLLALGAVAWMHRTALKSSARRPLQAYIFLFLFLLASTLLDLPIDLYSQHLSRAFGLSVQGWPSWWADQGKSFLLTWLIGGLLVLLLFWIIRRFPTRWWLVFWTFSIPITLLGIFITPYVIDPLFNNFEPLQKTHPALVAQLEQVVAKGHMDIPPDRMFLMKASEKVTTINAYVTGFGSSKRVVVWDTSLQKATPDEILFIFGHESGHYVLHHIAYGFLFTLLVLLLALWLGYHFVTFTLARFGTRFHISSQNDWAASAVLLLAIALFSLLLEPVQNTFSRHTEHAADVYGQEAIHGLVPDPQSSAQRAFDLIGANTFSDPNPSPWFEFWTYNHPSIGRRAAFAHAYNPWLPTLAPKYFTDTPVSREQ